MTEHADGGGASQPALLHIFGVFLKIGSLSFGGPYAILAYIEKETVERRPWLTQSDFARGVGIGHLTPGPIAFSAAVYAGYRLKRIPGSIAAALGLILPSFLIAVAFAIGYTRFAALPVARPILAGFNAAVIGLLVAIVLKMAKGVVDRWAKALLAVAAFASLLLKVNPVFIVVGAALFAVVLGDRFMNADRGGDAA
jgi:chromate transporter